LGQIEIESLEKNRESTGEEVSMRIEQINAEALEKVNYDRYLLAEAVARRVQELIAGDKPMVELPKEGMQYTEIAILEIAKGAIKVRETK
jgi:DNA-directed RNA polymerase subunit omega